MLMDVQDFGNMFAISSPFNIMGIRMLIRYYPRYIQNKKSIGNSEVHSPESEGESFMPLVHEGICACIWHQHYQDSKHPAKCCRPILPECNQRHYDSSREAIQLSENRFQYNNNKKHTKRASTNS